jgi:hypothetical protein
VLPLNWPVDFPYLQDSPLKVYCPTRRLLADVERLLAASRPGAHYSPLEDVIDLLGQGRHYAWVGIFLAVADAATLRSMGASSPPAEVALAETRSKILVSMKLASRELGVLSVESDREKAFGAQDRVLLESVANALARFLAARGKYLVRRARMRTTENREPGTSN